MLQFYVATQNKCQTPTVGPIARDRRGKGGLGGGGYRKRKLAFSVQMPQFTCTEWPVENDIVCRLP